MYIHIVNHYSAPYKCRGAHAGNKHVYSWNPYYTRGMCPAHFEWPLIMHPFTPGAAVEMPRLLDVASLQLCFVLSAKYEFASSNTTQTIELAFPLTL
jgi:hypothetical protein